jgi:hypothetical protein
MVRTRDAALAAVEAAIDRKAAEVSTLLDKEIDENFTGTNTVSMTHANLTDEATRDRLKELYEEAGWTVAFAEDTPSVGEFTISVT